jgi:hypothetical protein
MNLYMEMATLGVTFAACASGIFGMNLNSGIQVSKNKLERLFQGQ